MPIRRFRKGTYDKYFKRKMRRGRSSRRRTQSFKTRVRKVLLGKAETKKYQFAAENVQLQHNIGYNSNPAPPLITLSSMGTFFNVWADIPKGTASYNRIGDKITPRGMSLKIYLASKSDRPNTMYRVIVARAPKAINGVATTASSISDPFDALQLGNTNNKMLLTLDKDRGIKALYDKVHRMGNMQANSTVSGKEMTKYIKLWFRNRKARDIVYDSTNSDQIVNNPILLWIIPYEQYSTLQTDTVGSCSYYGTLYYKDI